MSDEFINMLQEDKESLPSLQIDKAITRAHKSSIYELFILGELMDEPHHGYQLREILSNLLGPFRQISWGVLYPLIRQLEQEELLVSHIEIKVDESEHRVSSNRQRKQYSITPSGRERFFNLMLERDDYGPDYRELFTIKLNNFDHLSPEQRLILLRHYQDYLQIENTYLQKGQHHVSTYAGIPGHQRGHILRTIDFRQSSVRGEIQWIVDQLADQEKGLKAMQ
jgi:DNA-binding PadR family transcriptional regulator